MRILAVLFNLILVPGVGHIAIGRWKRGLPWLILSQTWAPLALLNPGLLLISLLLPRIASAIEVGLLERRWSPNTVQASAVYGFGLFASVVLILVQRVYVMQVSKIASATMVPTLQIGDHVVANKLAYRFGEPQRGDLAVFVHPCDDRGFVERIVGLPGDTIEVRCDVLHVNGKAAPSTSLKEDCSYWDRSEESGAWVEEKCTTYVEKLGDREYEIVHSPSRRERDRLRKTAGGERPYEELRGNADFPRDILPSCPPGSTRTVPPAGRIEPSPMDPKAGACGPRSHYVVPDGHVFVMADNRESSPDSRYWGPVPLDHLKGKVVSIWWSSRPDQQGGIAWGRIGHLH